MGILPYRLIQCVLFCILSSSVLSSGSIRRVKDRIYFKLSSNKQCFRILNGTHQVGCQSAQGGSYGVLHWIGSDSDLAYVMSDPGKQGPFIAAINLTGFAQVKTIKRLVDSGKVNGILVFHSDDEVRMPRYYSEDSSCPNQASGLYKNDPLYGSCSKENSSEVQSPIWNENATGYRFMDFKIPIFLIHNKTEQEILRENCYHRFNKPIGDHPPAYPLCAVELLLFNAAAGSAERCLRRNELISGLDTSQTICDPLSGYNVFAFLPATNKSQELSPNSVLMLAARMDSFSMFSDYDPGAASALGNVIMMLSIAEALGRNKEFVAKESSATGRHLMPVLFHGESLDYIGSSRMIYDIQRKIFPVEPKPDLEDQPALLSLENLAMILELNQVANPAKKEGYDYYFHVDPKSMKNPETRAIIENATSSMARASSGVLGLDISWDMPLPPASAQRFLMVNRTIPAVVITDFDDAFQTRFYNSFSDKPIHLNSTKAKESMLKLANAVTRFLFEWVSDGKLPAKWEVDESVMERWADCFWNWPNYTCDVFDRLANVSSPFRNTYSNRDNDYRRTYIGTAGWPLRIIIQYLMTYTLGDRVLLEDETSKCTASAFSNRTGSIYTYTFMNDLFTTSSANYCYISTVNTSVALSPAFVKEGYDFKSGEYSTWMESRWGQPSLRIFLVTDPHWESSVFTVGILVTGLSFAVVYMINHGSNLIFGTTEVTAL